jgi:hypothetical protein
MGIADPISFFGIRLEQLQCHAVHAGEVVDE